MLWSSHSGGDIEDSFDACYDEVMDSTIIVGYVLGMRELCSVKP